MQRTVRSWTFPLLISAPDVTVGMQVDVLDLLFRQREVTLMGGATAVLTCAMLWPDLHWRWLIPWAAAVVAVGFLRRALGTRYLRRTDNRTIRHWALGFVLTTWAIGALWGGLELMVVGFGHNAIDKVYVILAGSGVIAAGAARNHGSPAGVLGQILLVGVPAVIAIFTHAKNSPFHIVGLLVILHMVATFSSARHLQGRLLAILRIDARNRELVGQLNEANHSLRASNAALETTSVTDELTGVTNRRGLMVALDRIWRHAARTMTPVGAIMIDIDHFKRYNDHLGHIEGDHCLRVVAATLAATLSRAGDLCARYGGEEFVVVLPGTDQEGCIHMAESLRAAIEARRIAHPASDLGRVSISLGIAMLIPRPEVQSVDLLTIADQALYRAKTLGRDRWEFGDVAACASVT